MVCLSYFLCKYWLCRVYIDAFVESPEFIRLFIVCHGNELTAVSISRLMGRRPQRYPVLGALNLSLRWIGLAPQYLHSLIHLQVLHLQGL